MKSQIILGLVGTVWTASAASAATVLDHRVTFSEVKPYSGQLSQLVMKPFSFPGQGRFRVTVTYSPWYRVTNEQFRWRSTVPIDGRDFGGWVEFIPGATLVRSRGIPDPRVDGAGLVIIYEITVRQAQPGMQAGIFPAVVRFGDGSAHQLPSSASAVIETLAAEEEVSRGAETARCVWRVDYSEMGVPYEWTWTQRGSSAEYDGVKRNKQTGQTATAVVRRFEHRPDRSVVFGPENFVGRFRGTYASDGKTAKGYTDWGAGEWTAAISGCDLAVTSHSVSPKNPATQAALPWLTPGATWQVTETAGGNRWEAVWTVQPDGRSLSATWTHFPGQDTGAAANFARIESITGDQIVIQRPGLGTYTGVLDQMRGTISGRPSWANATWEVTLPAQRTKPGGR